MNFTRLSLVGVSIALFVSPAVRSQEKLSYNFDIRPLLTDACFKCHGPAVQKSGLRLDVREEALKPARSKSRAIVPGKPDDSELVKRLFTTDESEIMPPADSHKKLSPADKEKIRRWIAEGAAYQKHWAFEPVVKPAIPGGDQKNPIDRFLAARLKKDGLSLSREADRPTLIRRVSFALTGLPPTLAEVDTFLADKSADAYEKMVDRFLASKHYGEEMARHWLDLARYADTHGLHLDNERQMWLYRDWVVKAFNSNMPFDRFTVEQLAGDLLPNPTTDQIIATGFLRCNVTTGEGGSIDSEWVYRNAVDRASTTIGVWLGLTGGCAVCHNHKYDPFTMKDYYSLYAFFLSSAGPALDGNALLTEPKIKTASPTKEQEISALNQRIAKVQKDAADQVANYDYKEPADVKLQGDPTRSLQAWMKRTREKADKTTPADVRNILKLGEKINADQQKRLRFYYIENVNFESKARFQQLAAHAKALQSQRDAIANSIPGSMVFRELDAPRQAFVMMRGQYDKPGDKVGPTTPSMLPPLRQRDAKTKPNRVDLARWLTAPDQPLTPRVTANRFWQQFFGTGIVKTSDDFGSQGSLPSHPALLDFLAASFRDSDWDVKALVRLMLTSAAFRQTSFVSPELIIHDPENRLHARGPRVRLEAEQIRDNALYVSGLINLEIGGRGVKPYQPPRIWEPVAFTGSNTGTYVQDKGGALYRRSLYIFLKRTAPPPFMANFDAPNRESYCSRRERSNTPLQALQLMNDIQHFEAARGLAQRMVKEGGAQPADRIRFVFRTVLSRTPEPDELKIVQHSLDQYLARYRKDPEAAKRAIRVGESAPMPGVPEPELAAYTLIANLILNLDETVTRN